MDFGEILRQWEKGQRKRKSRNVMDDYLDNYLPTDKDACIKESSTINNDKAEKRKKLLAIKPERLLDLHGFSVNKALHLLDTFITKCKRDGIKKILIIHGKGRHSKTLPVLGKRIRNYLEKCPLTGESGIAPKNMGGYGALWVIIR